MLIVTPMYGGLCMQPYMISILRLQEELITEEVRHDFLFLTGESLITRARNNACAAFLESEHDVMIFIDSDIQFTPEDIQKLYNHDAPVIGAGYPYKRIAGESTAWKDGQPVDLPTATTGPVDYIGTGFLKIHKITLHELANAYPEWRYTDDFGREQFAFFDTEIIAGNYLSEDYRFCHYLHEISEGPWLHADIRLRHWGLAGYGVPGADVHKVQIGH
jgi:glycosyltransferase involved in cell wall biosynthesis